MTTISVINTPTQIVVTQSDGNRVIIEAPPIHVVTVATVGIQGPAGPTGIDMVTVAEAVGGHRAITAEGLHATDSTLDLVIGVTLGAAASGTQVPYVAAGIIDEMGWAWVPNMPVFVGANGVLTQVEPIGTFRRIGTAVTATRLAVDLQPTIYRS